MKGKHTFVVSNRFIKYEFSIKRNITIIQGDSATGKTTLLNMLEAYSVEKDNSGIQVVSDVPVFVYRAIGAASWKDTLQLNEGSVVFIEEEYDFVSSKEFAEYLESSDSYYVIVTREDLENLPYSVEEIYTIKESGKYGTTSQVYNVFENVYIKDDYNVSTHRDSDEVNFVITEDSKAGFQFWNGLCDTERLKCISAYGKSNVVRCLRENRHEKSMIIVDGAAFGSQMRRLSKYIEQSSHNGCIAFLPESFEWLLMKSGVVQNISGLQDLLDNTYEYVDSKEYMSWERYYTALIVRETEGKPYHYNKNSLNDYYTGDKVIRKVVKAFPILEKIYTEQ